MLTNFIWLVISFFYTISYPEGQTEKWKRACENAPKYPFEQFFGRGIVIPAGGAQYLINACINLHMLRDHGCTLPVEIWVIGEEEIIPPIMEHLELSGATCHDITAHFDCPIKGWAVKVPAIIASRFQEVLLLDADNVAMRDPSFLFDTKEYRETGALFWPDHALISAFCPVLKVLEIKPKFLRAQESGQVLVDKSRCWAPLLLAEHMNKENNFYYKHILGDKDTLQLSWMCLKTSFTLMPYLACQVSKSLFSRPLGFLQRDYEGNPLFCHSHHLNWAERQDFSKIFHYFTLPDQPSGRLIPSLSLLNASSFDTHFATFEEGCLKYLKEVKKIASYEKSKAPAAHKAEKRRQTAITLT